MTHFSIDKAGEERKGAGPTSGQRGRPTAENMGNNEMVKVYMQDIAPNL